MDEERGGAHNEFGGTAENVVQAGRIGTINNHFHGLQPPRPVCQVPSAPAHYTNNERQLRALDEHLSGAHDGPPRVVIVRGSPGSGTTTLVNHWAHRHKRDYPDGQFFVRLVGGLDAPEREGIVLKELLQVTRHGAEEIPDSVLGRSAAWRNWSTDRRIILVVDDASTASQVSALLPGEGRSAVLVTSKGSLTAIRREIDASTVDMEPLSPESSRALLAGIVGSEAVAAEPDAVARLVELCGGLAVALSVVAVLLAEHPERPIARLARKLGEGRSLKGWAASAELSLAVVFDAAYLRRTELARRCYQVLGVHPAVGHVGSDAVAAVLDADPDDVADALAELAAAKLALREPDAEERYSLGELIHRHAAALPPDAERIRARLLEYYVRAGLAAEKLAAPQRDWRDRLWPGLAIDPLDGTAEEAMAWLQWEEHNLVAMARLAVDAGDVDSASKLALALWPLHERGGYSQNLVETNAAGLRLAQHEQAHLPATVFAFQGAFGHRQRNELDRAVELADAGQAAAQRSGSPNAEASIVELYGLLRLDQAKRRALDGDVAAAAELRALAEELLRRNVSLAERIGDGRRLALARLHLGKLGDADAAEVLGLARAEFVGRGEDYNVTKVDLELGEIALAEGRDAAAEVLLRAVHTSADENDWRREQARSAGALAELALRRDDEAAAGELLAEAERLYRALGMVPEADAARAKRGG